METGSSDRTEVGRPHMLLVRVGERACAIPLADVVEIMRPLPIERVDGAPAFVLGASVVRGVLSPVVDLARLLGAASDAAPRRFVSVRFEGVITSLAVHGVSGVEVLDDEVFHALSPLLRELSPDIVESAGTLDTRLLVRLRVTRTLEASRLLGGEVRS